MEKGSKKGDRGLPYCFKHASILSLIHIFVTEVSCPEGYRLDATPQNVIVKSGELATVTFENEKLAGVRIKKVDAVTGEGIYGVRFLIKDEDNNLIGEYSTDQDGYIELDDLLTDGKKMCIRDR